MAHEASAGVGTFVRDSPTERVEEGAWAKLRRRKVVQWGLAQAAVDAALKPDPGLVDAAVRMVAGPNQTESSMNGMATT